MAKNINMYPKVVIKFGFINEAGDLEKEAVRVLEWDDPKDKGVMPEAFMNRMDKRLDDECEVITIPGTSSL